MPLWNNISQLEHLATHYLGLSTKVMLLILYSNLVFKGAGYFVLSHYL